MSEQAGNYTFHLAAGFADRERNRLVGEIDIVRDLERVQTIAIGRGVRVRSFLEKAYGKWR